MNKNEHSKERGQLVREIYEREPENLSPAAAEFAESPAGRRERRIADSILGDPVSVEQVEPSVVSLYTQAYNDRDIDGMSALMHPDIQWLSIEGDEVVVFADGKPDLVNQMSEYMSSPQVTTSSLSGLIINGSFQAVKETARWPRPDGTTGEQAALAVYELDDGLIRRVCYYPAEK